MALLLLTFKDSSLSRKYISNRKMQQICSKVIHQNSKCTHWLFKWHDITKWLIILNINFVLWIKIIPLNATRIIRYTFSPLLFFAWQCQLCMLQLQFCFSFSFSCVSNHFLSRLCDRIIYSFMSCLQLINLMSMTNELH